MLHNLIHITLVYFVHQFNDNKVLTTSIFLPIFYHNV